ncbi:uncharacterized protein LOC135928826 [Gordionus sp. m RMFG-2023]|uniref:uncharacterized protein LOC135928826 n=1 Tax=Gordionus sp. m RMFG-2023 TaxID=3053472 RepID=UPI0031FD657B
MTIEVNTVEDKQQGINKRVELNVVEDNFNKEIKIILNRYKEVFKEELGTLRDFEVDIRLEQGYRPKYCSTRRLPFSWIEDINKELDKWLKEGIIKPIVHSVWATPLVPIRKPTTVSERTSKILTITTHRGLFAFCRLPFGLKVSAPIFQRTMAALFQGIKGIMYYLDDVLISGRREEEHNARLVKVLDIILENGLKANINKSVFGTRNIKYLGHIIMGDEITPIAKNIDKIMNMRAPNNKTEVQAFLEQRIIIIAVDASNKGIGGVLLQMTDRVEKPILFLSRRFSSTEKNYSRIEREALAVKFGLEKCKEYLIGRRFILYTDHKLLVDLFKKENKELMMSPRLQRWLILVGNFDFEIRFRAVSPPHYPRNGQVERMVAIVKSWLKKEKYGEGKWWLLLLAYNNTKTSKGNSPSEMFLGRKTRTELDFKERITQKEDTYDDKFKVGSLVWILLFEGPVKWGKGIISKNIGKKKVEVEIEGQEGTFTRHVKQMASYVRVRNKIIKMEIREADGSAESNRWIEAARVEAQQRYGELLQETPRRQRIERVEPY